VNTLLLSELFRIADEQPHLEQCGVICDGDIIILPNVHENPEQHFQLSHQDVVGYAQKNVIVWHTHTFYGMTQLSVPDVIAAKFLGQPMMMVRAKSHDVDYYDPKKTAPYVGRTFKFAHQNCYTLVQDYYRQEFGIFLKDYFPKSPTEFFSDAPSKFLRNLHKEGFSQVKPDDARVGDLVLTTEKQGAEGWHCSVVVKNKPWRMVLSQWVTRPSCVVPYRAIANRVHSVWRHKDARH